LDLIVEVWQLISAMEISNNLYSWETYRNPHFIMGMPTGRNSGLAEIQDSWSSLK
jgi:hypothetical protein